MTRDERAIDAEGRQGRRRCSDQNEWGILRFLGADDKGFGWRLQTLPRASRRRSRGILVSEVTMPRCGASGDRRGRARTDGGERGKQMGLPFPKWGNETNSFLLLSLTFSTLLHYLHGTRGSQLPTLPLNSEGFPRSGFGAPAVEGGCHGHVPKGGRGGDPKRER